MSSEPSESTQEARPLLYRISDVCELLNTGNTKVRELIASGELPSVRLGRSVRVAADDLDDFVQRLRWRNAA